MKKLIVGVLVLALSVLWSVPVGAVNINNFSISSYSVDMTLGRDAENRSTLNAKEVITAEFPSYDQNHGLERAFVTQYDGHNLSLNVTGVMDGKGNTLNSHWNGDTLRIGDADTYVHGTQSYVITYTMRDVTKYYSDTNKDEFYWDIIGTDWQVPIQKADIRLTLDSTVFSRSSAPYCYVGVAGSTTTCEFIQESSGHQQVAGEASSLTYTASVTDIGDGSGVTAAVGFMSGTFASYKQSLPELLFTFWALVQFVASPIAIVVMIWFFVKFMQRVERKKELGTIIPEYLPPKEASVTASARVGHYAGSTMTAQMLDLAVRHYVKIYEAKEKSAFSRAEYEIEVVQDISTLRAEEQELLKDMFGGLPSIGGRMNLKKLQNNTAYYSRTLNNDSELDKLIRGGYGFRAQDEGIKKWSRSVARVLLVVGVIFLSPFWFIASLMAFVASFMAWRLTDNGLALKRYLEGLKMYIGVAEEERIKMLQSPEGAEKVHEVATGTDDAQLIKLYERVLPYAVLFGQEKEWNKQLGHYYEAANTNPDWYSGHNAVFNAAVFSSAMNSFSQANSYASSSSSSTGGSSGGGFSGGGGGGGGGGGW
jgi:uncharacterized membrane protein YgcG